MRIRCDNLRLELSAPPSKSIYHRELIVNYIRGARGSYLESQCGDSVDVTATKECLRAIDSAALNSDIVLPCHESGSTIRFMIPVALALAGSPGRRLIFGTEGRLIDRPIEELADCLRSHNISIVKEYDKSQVAVTGTLAPGKYVIDGSVSSQYISGLLMALSALKEDSEVEVTSSLSSVHYIELTTEVLRKYGTEIVREGGIFHVPALRKTAEGGNCADGSFTVEGDWSNGAFLLALGSLIRDGGVTCSGLNIQSAQGDVAILGFMSELGIRIDNDAASNCIHVGCAVRNERCALITRDCNDTPDIVPYMAVLGAFFASKTVLTGISRLRLKESDRVRSVCEMLGSCGIKACADENSITVYGINYDDIPEEISLTSSNDHRMCMTAVLLAAGLGREIEIDDIECLDKSFPEMKGIIAEEMRL